MEDPKKSKHTESLDKKKVTLDRAVSMNIERVPLTSLSKYKTVSPKLLGRWKSYRKGVTMQNTENEDDDCHCMKRGESPPADDMVLLDSFEDFGNEAISVRICRNSVRQGLLDLMKPTANGNGGHYLEDIEAGKVTVQDAQQLFAKSSKMERNIAFLWAAFVKRLDFLKWLYSLGVDINFSEPIEGFTALHLSAFSGCVECSKFLISSGANINLAPMWFTPLHSAAFGNSFEVARLLLNNGARLDVTGRMKSNDDFIYGTPLHSAVKANAVECVQLLIGECPDINSVEPGGVSPLHSAAELGHAQPLKILLDAGVDCNLVTRDKKNTALHLAAEGGFPECVSLLLSKGANADARNYRGQTPLHLAARVQSLECVEMLLNIGGCDPNAVDTDKRTPLHSAVGKSLLAFEITETLLIWKAEVNKKDKYGYTPLHIAALNEQSQCVETLLYHGADVSAKTKGGTSALSVIVRKTPASLAMLYQKLDCAISLLDPEASNREVELKMDFRILLQNCHMGEISFLKTFVDAGQKDILEHPLCEAFLYLKWEKIRKYYIARLLFYLIFVLSLSAYVLMALAHNCYNSSKAMNNATLMRDSRMLESDVLCKDNSMIANFLRKRPIVTEVMWYVLVFFTVIELIRKLIGLAAYSSFKQYLCQMENLIEWFVIVSVFVISCIYTGRTYTWQNHVGAFAVLLGWVNLMVMIGQLPMLGCYVAMYTSVQKEFAKLFAAYLCLLIGFTISFCVIFPTSDAFGNPFVGFMKVLVMMTGELEFEDLILGKDDEKKPAFLLEVSAHITFIIFLVFVTVVLMNLLVGIAVHDIQGLQKTAGLLKLVRQTELIAYIESALFSGYLPHYIIKLLQWTALVSPSAYWVAIQVKPLNPREKRLPKNVLKAAYEIAKNRKRCGHTVSSRGSSNTTSFTYIKSRAASFNEENKNIFPQTQESPNVQSLYLGVEEGSKAIAKLSEELKELKEATKLNQIILNQLLDVLNKKCSDC
ncbi:transient receptor potential channel pyrexia [Periplaneta americana]|uniref:transient receptor potential channel pyrexia n=1 Tax=Periplaneta americana TaxID=6978 RepID=UPI0037E8B6D1